MDHDCAVCGLPCDCGKDGELCECCSTCVDDPPDYDDDYDDEDLDRAEDDGWVPTTTFDDDGSDEGTD